MATKKRYYPLRSPANPTKVVLVEITEEQYQAVFPEIWAARKREQRHGRCKCLAEYSWTCNADCLAVVLGFFGKAKEILLPLALVDAPN